MSTIYYFKGVPIIAPVSLETDELNFENTSISRKTDRQQGASQRWLVSFKLAPTGNFAPLIALFTNYSTPVTFNFPQFTPGLASLTAATTATAAVSTTTITAASDVVTALTVGRMIKFANHSKIYMVSEKLTSTTFSIYPALVSAVNSATNFDYGSNVQMTAYVSSEVRGLTFVDGILEDLGTILCKESV